jgi:signal transduction histidine kinase
MQRRIKLLAMTMMDPSTDLAEANALLAALGLVLASSTEHEDEVLAAIAQMAATDFADLCIIDIATSECAGVQRKVAQRGPTLADVSILSQPPRDVGNAHHEALVRGSAPSLVVDVSSAHLRSIAQDDDAAVRALSALEPRSMIAVPLSARGQHFGVIVLLRTKSAAVQFGASQLAAATELGRRAAIAIDNMRALRTAQAAVRAREDTLSLVAHDLRGPLTVVLVEAGRLKVKPSGEVIEAAARRMSNMVDELLCAARADSGQIVLRRERTEMAPLLRTIIDGHAPLAHQLKIDLELRVDAAEHTFVDIDLDHVLRVFENLIGNALKFTPPGGRVVVTASRCAGEVVFSVSDNGPGIPAEDIPHLFDRFWQGKNSRAGTGVGLAIVKRFVEAHGGTIRVRATPDAPRTGTSTGATSEESGATFSFSLPLATP